jgi:O-antigen ligase
MDSLSLPYFSRGKLDFIIPLFILLCSAIAIASDEWRIFIVPFLLLFIWLSVIRPHWIYFLLLFTIPFSTELDLPGGFSTDFPDEILMWWMFGLGILLLIKNKSFSKEILKYPLTLVILIHWVWIIITCISSVDISYSIKYWLSKSWYLMNFYVLGIYFLKEGTRKSVFANLVLVASCITVLIIETKHAFTGFAFSEINESVRPFYRNHVNYACLLVAVFPFIYPLWKKYQHQLITKTIVFCAGIILLAGILFSYTRAAYISLFSIFIFYPIIRYRLVNLSFVLAIFITIAGVLYFTAGNRYLELAPDYNKAVSHTDFGNLLEATPQGKDISTMERLYRWVAGGNMIVEKPVLGFGPANFYNAYQSFTLTQFTTYVSDNEERSSIHNYYLMIAVEQGIPGLIIFLAILYFYFKMAEQFWQASNTLQKHWILASVWSMGAILMILIFNDMVESDKVGSFFFLNMAILVCNSYYPKGNE